MRISDRLPDSALLAATVGGDADAFAAFYRRHLPVVLRWCLSATRDRELAADLTGEVFAAALIAARRYDASAGPAVAWLLGIARNKLRESQRRGRVEDVARRRLAMRPLELTDDDLERVEQLASSDGAMLEQLKALPVAQREALVGHVLAERSYADLAAQLSCSESVVRQRVSRGLAALRAQEETT